MVKYVQGILIQKDERISPCEVNTSSLNEECGQIHYIFSDKTGTLTANRMIFKKLIVKGIGYGDDCSLSDEELSKVFLTMAQNEDPKQLDVIHNNVNFNDRLFLNIVQDKSNMMHEKIHEALLHITLCHSVIAESPAKERNEQKSNKEDKKGKKFIDIIYNTSSPDELALINFARMCGYLYLGVDQSNIVRIQF